jgi:formylmethanofuran dehydrogenase subunit A
MGDRRLIAVKTKTGYACAHLSGEGSTIPPVLDEHYNTMQTASALIAQGDLAVIKADRFTPHYLEGHEMQECADLHALFQINLINEYYISIFDPTGAARAELDAWNAANDNDTVIVNPDETGGWIHIGEDPFAEDDDDDDDD